ncbi:sulfite exporter TauE/SafE family protein [Myxococcus llanfairpwllgwyngyllgogerychwyrndrobwllllantysiliogogogochensis]|uniref:Probable membrane transporter protein n=1 Tax=Myxococcus llanfairpwllgwyngyllgogerychwyrndrobwllllantysiliogogogochensis TaxID=2590453 RepID=A0A540X7F6_9BACT|nr:sulfite exporter TauE/SafE family protein [Myxococcus llanfairpwllgwyngyllgogerychwyrndrobwllllantysiliogogogochensis]TQF16634.1 sulfite exporter TauE/SafE family protein [Myxococcus llanfairpwllgwyngyllgogerychwyrndrobwllllantysiliogogogochensis]
MMLYVGLAGALLVGVLLGLLGGGGSILTVPLLVYVLGVEPRTAIAMSLVVVGVTSASGALFHARAGRVRWRTAFVFGAGGMVGAFLGGKLNPLFSASTLMLFFAGVMVAAAVAMLLRTEATRVSTEVTPRAAPHVGRILLQGLGVGILSGLVGAGGGFLIVPALALVGLSTPMATATSLVVIALQCAAGLVGHLGHVELPWKLTGEVLAVALAGSLLGGKLAGHVAPGSLRKGFAVFVLATATFLLWAQLPLGLRARLGQGLASAGAWPWVAVATGVGLPIVLWRLRVVRQRATRGH